jgi:ComF family protein
MTLRQITNAVLSALFAPPCAACNTVLEHPLDGAVCERCWAAIVVRQERFSLDAVACARAIGPYEGTLRRLVHALKYEGRRSIAPRLARLMAMQSAAVLAGTDYVVPVPLHRARRRERGFNQAEDLARGLGVPVLLALCRPRPTRPQVDLPAEERRDNVRHAFAIRRQGHQVRGRTIVLVDDVATTGATLEACARVLTRAGATEVRALTAARVASAPH